MQGAQEALDPDHAVLRMSPTAGWARDKDKHTIAAGGHRLVLRAVEGHAGPARQVVTHSAWLYQPGRQEGRLTDTEGKPGAERGPIDATRTPRFAGPPTFALLPRRDEVRRCDVAVAGVPFDSGTSYRPGARFGPSASMAGSVPCPLRAR